MHAFICEHPSQSLDNISFPPIIEICDFLGQVLMQITHELYVSLIEPNRNEKASFKLYSLDNVNRENGKQIDNAF